MLVARECIALPASSWALRDVAAWCGCRLTATQLDGFEVGSLCSEHRSREEAPPCSPGESFACSTRPVRVVGGLAFRAVQAGTHGCGVTTDDVAYCWGPNHDGELGGGTTTHRLRTGRGSGAVGQQRNRTLRQERLDPTSHRGRQPV